MTGFVLHGDGDTDIHAANLFLDNYMPEANGEYVKIYLYLLRCLKSDTQSFPLSSLPINSKIPRATCAGH